MPVPCTLCKNAVNDQNFKKYNCIEKSPFADEGFSRWNNQKTAVEKHAKSNQHKKAFECYRRLYCTNVNNNDYIDQNIMNALGAEQAENREYLRLLCLNTRLLAKQGLAFRGKTPESSNFVNVLNTLVEATKTEYEMHKKLSYTHNDYQNDIIKSFYNKIMRNHVKHSVKLNKHFCIMCDEGTDASNTTLLTIVLRQVTDDLEIKEYFLGFYALDNIKSDHIVKCITVSF